MPDQTEQAAAPGDAPAAPAASAAYDGLPAEVRQALADFPDDPTPDQQPAASTEATADAGQQAEQAGDAPKGDKAAPETPKQDQPAITAEAIKAALDAGTLSVDDLIKTPGIDGRVGQMVQRLRERERLDQAAEAERARKYQLAESDPDHPLSQEVLREKQQLDTAAALANVEGQVFTRMVGAIGAWVGEKLPAEVVKTYRETVAGQPTTLPDLVDRISSLRVEHALKTEVEKRVKDELEAKWHDFQAERLGGEPAINKTPASNGGGKQLTQRDIEAMDWREYAKVEQDILAGRIKLVAA